MGKFARWGIEARLGSDLEIGVRKALHHYVRCLRSGWLPPRLPRFRLNAESGSKIPGIELEVDEDTRAALEEEVRRHGAPLEQVATHAVLVYLAHLDAGLDVDRACESPPPPGTAV